MTGLSGTTLYNAKIKSGRMFVDARRKKSHRPPITNWEDRKYRQSQLFDKKLREKLAALEARAARVDELEADVLRWQRWFRQGREMEAILEHTEHPDDRKV